MAKLLFFIDQEFVGETTYDPQQAPHWLEHFNTGALLYCPQCGDVWARIVVEKLSPYVPNWQAWSTPCVKHPRFEFESCLLLGGSLLSGRDNFIDYLPPNLVRREFEIHNGAQPFTGG